MSVAVSFLALSPPAWSSPESDAKAARESFKTYLDALATKDGKTAVGLVTDGTLEYYEKMRVAALEAPAKAVHGMRVIDQLFVLLLRAQLEPKALRGWSANQLFVESVQRGWIGAGAITQSSLGKISARGELAVGKLAMGGEELPFEWQFERQKGVWKNDLVPTLRFLHVVLAQQLKSIGKPESQFVLEMVEAATGRKPTPSLWDPPATAGTVKK